MQKHTACLNALGMVRQRAAPICYYLVRPAPLQSGGHIRCKNILSLGLIILVIIYLKAYICMLVNLIADLISKTE